MHRATEELLVITSGASDMEAGAIVFYFAPTAIACAGGVERHDGGVAVAHHWEGRDWLYFCRGVEDMILISLPAKAG